MCVYEAQLQHTHCVKVSSCSSDVKADVQPLWWWRGWATVTDLLLRGGCQPSKPLPFDYLPSVYVCLSFHLSLSLLLCLPGWVGFRQCITHVPLYVSSISPLISSLLLSHHGGTSLKSGLFLLFSPLLSFALHSVCLGVCFWVGMLVSATALLGATLGTVSGVLTLCGLSLLCKSCKKGKLERGDETDPEKAKPSILHTLTQVRLKLTHTQPWTCNQIWYLNTRERAY